MNNEDQSLAKFLLSCEQAGYAPPYVVQPDTYKEARGPYFGHLIPVRTTPVKYTTQGEEVFVVSDLHIATGRNHVGVFGGTENFFADDAFFRFLDHAHRMKNTNNALLIINGDIFDFLRVTEFPGKVRQMRLSKLIRRALHFKSVEQTVTEKEVRRHADSQFNQWAAELALIGINRTTEQLEKSISRREKKLGLGTSPEKTIYKLIRIHEGHPQFFQALALWLERGHKLIVLKGNHDLEIYWPEVRNYLRLILAREIVGTHQQRTVEDVLRTLVLPNITFVDDSIEIDGDFYVEHGHRYDKFTMVLDTPALAKYPDQINMPFGSFFNRYLINRVELFYPFLDNVRPTANVLPMLMRENFPLALKVLFQHIPLIIRILLTNLRYTWFMIHKVVPFAVVVAIPVVYIALAVTNSPLLKDLTASVESTPALKFLFGQLKIVTSLALSYGLARLVAWVQLTEPESLERYARIRAEGTDYRIMAMGHTHNPGEYLIDGKHFYNTGTWIPVVEMSTASVRDDKTYTFLHLVRDAAGNLQPAANGLLQRWNDDAERPDPQVLVMRK